MMRSTTDNPTIEAAVGAEIERWLARLTSLPLAILRDGVTSTVAGAAALHAPEQPTGTEDVLQTLRFLTDHADEVATALASGDNASGLRGELADRATRAVAAWIWQQNQYVVAGTDWHDALRRHHAETLSSLASGLESRDADAAALAAWLRMLVEAYLSGIRTLVESAWPAAQSLDALYSETICAEYSPELQCELLGLDLDQLREPVLDIGCGETAQLVKSLAERGVDVLGIDRRAPDTPNTSRADWLELDIERGAWGTIIAHMSFANHFVFHDRVGSSEAPRYARQWTALLHGLRSKGALHYAPALPFVEAHLPRDVFELERRRIPAHGTGGALEPHAVVIRRRD